MVSLLHDHLDLTYPSFFHNLSSEGQLPEGGT